MDPVYLLIPQEVVTMERTWLLTSAGISDPAAFNHPRVITMLKMIHVLIQEQESA